MIDNIARMVILLSCLYILSGGLLAQGDTWSMEGKDRETPQAPTIAFRTDRTQHGLYQEDFNDGKAQGSSISVYLDDMEKPQITLQDDSLKGGYIGFKVSHFPNYWLIDNIQIRPL